MTVAVMKMSLTRSEYFRWISYYQSKNPEIEEIQLAVIASMVARGLGSKDAKAEDFIISKTTPSKQKELEMDANDVGNFFSGML